MRCDTIVEIKDSNWLTSSTKYIALLFTRGVIWISLTLDLEGRVPLDRISRQQSKNYGTAAARGFTLNRSIPANCLPRFLSRCHHKHYIRHGIVENIAGMQDTTACAVMVIV